MWMKEDSQARSQKAPITYAALLERFEKEQEITDDMVREACANMEAAQVYPFAAEIRGDV